MSARRSRKARPAARPVTVRSAALAAAHPLPLAPPPPAPAPFAPPQPPGMDRAAGADADGHDRLWLHGSTAPAGAAAGPARPIASPTQSPAALAALDALVLGTPEAAPPEATDACADGRQDVEPLRVGVLAPAGAVAAAVGGAAAESRARCGARTAVVATARAPVVGLPPLPRAAALARRLRAQDLPVTATGALCHVRLPDDPAEAERLLERIAWAGEGAPVVVGVAERSPAADALLATSDRLVAALPPSAAVALAALTVGSLERLGPPVDLRRLPRDPLARRAVAAGLRPLARPADPPGATGAAR